ncbi:MAG: NgoPII family restriction endonuclease, partial [Tetragenococcus halophilus]|nr:NgoPII family restriction endonuclease [Tetragenococcus halophilus]
LYMKASTNILVALYNILKRNSTVLTPIYKSNGAPNAAGDSLEFFIKDMFCTGASQYFYEHEKNNVYAEYLSWTGDSSHFPDFIVKGGVGVEPKKINNKSIGNLALNSSYPKDYIYPDSQNIPGPELLRENENWDKKEIIYVVGNLDKTSNKLFSLWMVYGNTFIADKSVYLNIIEEIRTAVAKTNATLSKSKELARAIGIDPLRHSNLRVRGMYELNHPAFVFRQYIDDKNHVFPKDATQINVVMLKKDFLQLEKEEVSPDLTDFYNKGKLLKKEILLPDPNDLNNKIESVILYGYTN